MVSVAIQAKLAHAMGERIVHFYGGRSTHAFYREQLEGVPSGFVYRTDADEELASAPATRRLATHGRRFGELHARAEWASIRLLSYAGFVRRARVRPVAEAALVHSAQFPLRDCKIPYVLDFECMEAFVLYQRVALRRPWARALLRRALSDPNLRFLLPWSEASRRGLQSALGPEFAADLADRTITVLPAIRPVVERPRERSPGLLRVLFIGTAFVAKGGVEAVRAVERARLTHDISLDVVSDVPVRWGAELERAAGVTIHAWPAAEEIVRGLFARSEVLLFPSHMDTLGFVMLEAMAHGMPVLATRHFAVPEIVEHDVSGLVVAGENPLYGEDGLCRFDRTLPPPRGFRDRLAVPSDAYVDRLATQLVRLAEDRALHARLAAGALERVHSGPLSVASRQESLGEVYRRAIST